MSERIRGRRTAASIGRVQPVTVDQVVEETGLTREEVVNLFDEEFGGWDEYRRLCLDDPKELVDVLAEKHARRLADD